MSAIALIQTALHQMALLQIPLNQATSLKSSIFNKPVCFHHPNLSDRSTQKLTMLASGGTFFRLPASRGRIPWVWLHTHLSQK
ncbi:hypothetical protein [Coleofasciculus sp. FACHB-1120]|uniref:hypothetical protein n=1 Tax=Coleofasciculus sp. FACHB-1120 TaxID=2692783 RepID=UPI001684914B|nr:hypothetical protein [Coleofasciculus sp. FACHB-1120]MBD2741703.1 hypothetical protein [Coleofasciculus sp. FACHB-1120]